MWAKTYLTLNFQNHNLKQNVHLLIFTWKDCTESFTQKFYFHGRKPPGRLLGEFKRCVVFRWRKRKWVNGKCGSEMERDLRCAGSLCWKAGCALAAPSPFCWAHFYHVLGSSNENFKYGVFPGGPVVKNLPCRAGDTGSISGPQMTPHATEKLSLYTANTEPRPPRAQCSTAREAAKAGSPATQLEHRPCSLQVERACRQPRRPRAARKK